MAVAEAIKEYIARNYGDGKCITTDTGDDLGTACLTDNLATPLPSGYTSDDICSEEVITWAYNNVGWCITVPTPTPTPKVTPTPTPKVTPTPTPAPKIYTITLESSPSGAWIEIDDKDTYRMTPETFDLKEGSHDVVLTKDGYEDKEQTIYVNRSRTYSWTLTPIPTPTPKPIEIEVVKPKLGGSVNIGRSGIPRVIAVTIETSFRIHVDNPPTGTISKYRVTLTFEGPNTYSYISDWSEAVNPDDYVNINISVTLPADAIPAGKERAYYDLFTILEAEKV